MTYPVINPARGLSPSRRINTLRLSPAENAIRNAMIAVEEAGADPLLTDAVNLLQQARDKVADYIDSQPGTTGSEEDYAVIYQKCVRIANTVQCATECSSGLTRILTQELVALADEIVRKAVEP